MPATKTPRSLGIVLVHGGFHQSSCFDLAKGRLEAAGFSPVVGVDLPSVGTNPSVTLDDDARSIQTAIEPHLEQGREFLALAHSYGGTPLTIATKRYSIPERAAEGKKGGIRAVIYLTANMPPKKSASALSVLPPGLDIVDVSDDGLVRANAKAKAAFYGPDMADELADAFMAALLPQSSAALFGGASVGLDELAVPAYYIVGMRVSHRHWAKTHTSAQTPVGQSEARDLNGQLTVPSRLRAILDKQVTHHESNPYFGLFWLFAKDQTIAPVTQEEIIATIPTLRRVLRNPGGHSAFITEVGRFVEQVVEIAEEVEREVEVEA